MMYYLNDLLSYKFSTSSVYYLGKTERMLVVVSLK